MIRNYFSILFLLLVIVTVNAQPDNSQHLLFNQIYSVAEAEYGIHQELVNGLLFEEKNQEAIGHPYFLDYYSDQGSMIYRGKQYSNLNLRYDIYDQQVLLIYLINDDEYKLHLHKEFIKEFIVAKRKFIIKTFDTGEEAKIYQVLGKSYPVQVLYFWKKELTRLYANNSDKAKYEKKKEAFILLDNELVSFKGNRSFTSKFSSNKTGIKKYIRKNRIKVRYAADDEMESLMGFINTLKNQGNK